ncbi:hypothetical protein FQR65_LT16677 [Abscondita terminalis]|nr:hypothetical protein FQR65_LT16677 [Abscondita terminalis]
MKIVAKKLASKIEVLLVIGIGGSYLGARAAEEMINGLYKTKGVELIYVDKEFGIVNISKSGTTTEPGIAFRVYETLLASKVSKEELKERIVAVTDKSKGALKTLATNEGYKTFTIPDDIGGRFSVTTPVGIFPLLVAGVNVDDIFKGAVKAHADLKKENNDAYDYAVARYLLHSEKKYSSEMLVTYELQMQYFIE